VTDPDLVGEALGDFMGSGWVRHLPHCALFIFGAAATLEAESRRGSLQQVEAYARDGGLTTWCAIRVGSWRPGRPADGAQRRAAQSETSPATAR
jgi:hypothetical protein